MLDNTLLNVATSSVLNSCLAKLIFRSENEEKKIILLHIYIWLLNHKKWDEIVDGANIWNESLQPKVLIVLRVLIMFRILENSLLILYLLVS